MKSLKNLTGDSLEQLIDYQVVDQNGDEIGSLHSLWSEPDTGAVEFLGVKTGWIFGHNHVVPAEKAELDETENVVRLPYTATFIKEAPSISADAEISEAEEANIYTYYGLDRTGPSVETSTMASPVDATGAGTYVGTTASAVPEAAGAAALAGAGGGALGAMTTGDPATGDPATGTPGNDEGSAARWRRTSRSLMNDAISGGEIDRSNPTRNALDDLVPGATSGSAATADSYRTSNLYGSTGGTTPVADDSPGAANDAAVGNAESNLATGRADVGGTTAPRPAPGTNPDLITGEPGSHPVGTGTGALGAGAAGMAIGAVGGPVGAAIGGVIGVVSGAVAGRAVAESINPTEEDAHWQSNYRNTNYFQNDYEYADYAPAYRAGYEGYGRYAAEGKDYSEVEPDLERDYHRTRGNSRLEWDHAKAATRDAWERLKAKASNTVK